MHEKSTPFLKIKYRIVGLAMINDCGQFQICNIDDRCIILEIVKFLLFYIYLQYTSDQQGLHVGSRVQWFSTFFRFYHMVVFHEWDLLVLRPLKKKKKFFAHPTLRASASKISFSKNRRDLKNEYFFLKICRILPNTSKNNRHK